ACARIEATTKGLDIRFVVTSIEICSAEHIYQTLYCARGQAENLIKLHKAHALATAEFNTIRLRLLKLGARVVEMTSRVRLAFAAACPDATLIHHIAAALMPTG